MVVVGVKQHYERVSEPTEPKKGAGRGSCLRPSHIFSSFSGIFDLGLTPCVVKVQRLPHNYIVLTSIPSYVILYIRKEIIYA